MDFKIKKIAMTGGTGPVGMALIQKLLDEDIEIFLFQREESERRLHLPKDERLHIENCSLEQLKDFVPQERDYDVFFHLGWTNTLQKLREDMGKQFENVKYSCDAVKLAYEMGCHTFIGAGSQAEYGRHEEPLRDDTLCTPENAYGITKLSACHSTRILCQKYGIRHIWPRILSGYGKYDNKYSVLVSNIINVLEGRQMKFSKGEQIWDFLYMDDLAEALYLLAKKGKDNQIYPIGSGKARPLKEYIAVLCDKLGKTDEMVLGEIPYGEKQIMHLEADISKLKRDTGWEPRVEFEEGIERVIEYYKTANNEIFGGDGRICMKNDVMVSVICTAYNHEKFIKDAIEGVLSQETDFRYELILHDDASTDRTPEIIKAYAKKHAKVIRTILQKENQFSRCHIYPEFLFPAVKGKYIAFCEGDDYWTDKHKLQKQVDFMESHTEYSMCMHNAVKLNYETGEEKLLDTFPEEGTYSQKEQILAGLGTDFPAFASLVFRTNLLEGIPDFFLASNVVDYPIRQYLASRGKVYYFKEPMSVYRTATPWSYMKMAMENQLAYNNYILDMIYFFENLNQYTDRKFSRILEDRLLSDYFGFCCSVSPEEGVKKAAEKKLDVRMVEACYRCMDPEYIDESVLEVSKKSGYLFIYGTSRLAPVCKRQLESAGISFEGFVVSDGQMKMEVIEDKRVFCLSEVIEQYENPGFILAVQPVNAKTLENVLKQYHLKNYCMPYNITGMEKGEEK